MREKKEEWEGGEGKKEEMGGGGSGRQGGEAKGRGCGQGDESW